jgi:hypothetical protein
MANKSFFIALFAWVALLAAFYVPLVSFDGYGPQGIFAISAAACGALAVALMFYRNYRDVHDQAENAISMQHLFTPAVFALIALGLCSVPHIRTSWPASFAVCAAIGYLVARRTLKLSVSRDKRWWHISWLEAARYCLALMAVTTPMRNLATDQPGEDFSILLYHTGWWFFGFLCVSFLWKVLLVEPDRKLSSARADW